MKSMIKTITHCEWCGKRVENISYRTNNKTNEDPRYLVHTDKGSLKVCGNCYQYMNVNDKLPNK